jgi:hypothetical protein
LLLWFFFGFFLGRRTTKLVSGVVVLGTAALVTGEGVGERSVGTAGLDCRVEGLATAASVTFSNGAGGRTAADVGEGVVAGVATAGVTSSLALGGTAAEGI